MQFKPATVDQIPQLHVLYEELFSEMAAMQPTYLAHARQSHAYLINIFLSSSADILVAEKGGELLGFMLIQEQATPPYQHIKPRRFAYLADLLVRRPYRGQGIGKAFIQEAKNWARRRGLDYLELNVLAQNVAAIGLYKSENFSAELHTMRCTV